MKHTMRLILVLFLIASSSCESFTGFSCEDTAKTIAPAPDREYEASVYERDCGATTDFSTIVNLHLVGEDRTNQNGIVFVAKGQKEVQITWLANRKVNIICKDCSSVDIFRNETSWGDVTVSYGESGN